MKPLWSFIKTIGGVYLQVVRTVNDCELCGQVDQANKCLVKGERVFGLPEGRTCVRFSFGIGSVYRDLRERPGGCGGTCDNK